MIFKSCSVVGTSTSWTAFFHLYALFLWILSAINTIPSLPSGLKFQVYLYLALPIFSLHLSFKNVVQPGSKYSSRSIETHISASSGINFILSFLASSNLKFS